MGPLEASGPGTAQFSKVGKLMIPTVLRIGAQRPRKLRKWNIFISFLTLQTLQIRNTYGFQSLHFVLDNFDNPTVFERSNF